MNQNDLQQLRQIIREETPPIVESIVKSAMRDLPTKDYVDNAIQTATKDLPTTKQVDNMIQKAIVSLPTVDDFKKIVHTEVKSAMKYYPTKDEMYAMGEDIIDTLGDMIETKADVSRVKKLESLLVS